MLGSDDDCCAVEQTLILQCCHQLANRVIHKLQRVQPEAANGTVGPQYRANQLSAWCTVQQRLITARQLLKMLTAVLFLACTHTYVLMLTSKRVYDCKTKLHSD
jgi:hypothetical protein